MEKINRINSDIHNHSEYSFDSEIKIEELIKRASEFGINALGITNHYSAYLVDDYLHGNANIEGSLEKTIEHFRYIDEINEKNKYNYFKRFRVWFRRLVYV